MTILQILLSAIVLLFGFFVRQRLLLPLATLELPGVSWAALLLLLVGMGSILWLPLVHWRSEESTMSSRDRFLERSAHFWMGFFSLLFFVMVVREGATLILWIAGIPYERLFTGEFSLLILGLAAGFSVTGLLIAKNGPRIREIEVKLPHGPQAPLTIAQLSDLHVGTAIGADYVRDVVERTNALQPDLIALTGDIADGDPNSHDPDLEPLRGLRARYGVYYSTGNHEFYWDESAWKEKFRSLGMKILDNQSETISIDGRRILVAGVNDLRPNYDSALSPVDPGSLKILLAHQPKHIVAAEKRKVDLQLSGHTHAGQFLPWSLIIGLFQKYSHGLYRVGRSLLYVNAGTGFWGPPLRLGTRSEITFLRLTKE